MRTTEATTAATPTTASRSEPTADAAEWSGHAVALALLFLKGRHAGPDALRHLAAMEGLFYGLPCPLKSRCLGLWCDLLCAYDTRGVPRKKVTADVWELKAAAVGRDTDADLHFLRAPAPAGVDAWRRPLLQGRCYWRLGWRDAAFFFRDRAAQLGMPAVGTGNGCRASSTGGVGHQGGVGA